MKILPDEFARKLAQLRTRAGYTRDGSDISPIMLSGKSCSLLDFHEIMQLSSVDYYCLSLVQGDK